MGSKKARSIFESEVSSEEMSKWNWDMTRDDVCEAFNISGSTIDRWAKDGLPIVKRGKVVRFSRQAVYYFMEERLGAEVS